MTLQKLLKKVDEMKCNTKALELAKRLSVSEKKEWLCANFENYDSAIEILFEFLLEELRKEISEDDFVSFCDSL